MARGLKERDIIARPGHEDPANEHGAIQPQATSAATSPRGCTKDTEDTGELPFDEREATPLNADDPAPQRVTTYPVVPGRKRRAGRDTIGPASMVSTVAGAGTQEVFLYAEHGPGTGQLLPVGEGALTLGRSSSCDLRLPHASISRRHARLTRRGERLFLEDWELKTAPSWTTSGSRGRASSRSVSASTSVQRSCGSGYPVRMGGPIARAGGPVSRPSRRFARFASPCSRRPPDSCSRRRSRSGRRRRIRAGSGAARRRRRRRGAEVGLRRALPVSSG